MIMSLLFLFLLILAALLCVVAGGIYAKSRIVSVKLLAPASREFFDNADKLMKNPQDLPDSIFDGLNIMSESLNDKKGSRALLRILRKTNNDPVQPGQPGHPDKLQKDLTRMRPELQEIFGCAVAGWLNFVTHRYFIPQQKIIMELAKMAIKQGRSGINKRDAGIFALEQLKREGVVC